MQTFKINQANPDPLVVAMIAELLRAGAVIAFPTDTFYGLGADIYSETAIKRLFEIKGRMVDKPILILISNKEELIPLLSAENNTEVYQRLVDEYWPGPLTLVFNASEKISPVLTGGTGRLGVRLPDHNFCKMLIQSLGSPITATSANISGCGSLDNPSEVLTALGDHIDVLVDGGKTRGGSESTVVDVSGNEPVILREGAISSFNIRLK